MIVYIIVYSVSLLLIFISTLLNDKHKFIRKSLIVIALLIPCVIAGTRAISIGTDTSKYIIRLFKLADKSNTILEFFRQSNKVLRINDYGYLLVTFITTKSFHNFHILLFVYELLIIIPLYKSLRLNQQNKYDIIIAMFIFYMFFYNVTFNMARQSIALSFTILGVSFLDKSGGKKIIKPILCFIIAFLFHSTAIINVITCLFFYILHNQKQQKVIKKILLIIVYLASIFIVFDYTDFITLLYKSGLYKHGILYLQNYSKLDFSFADTFTYLFVIISLIMNKETIKTKNYNYDFYLAIAMESIILLQLGTFIQYLERISFYCFYPVLFNMLPTVGTSKKGISKNMIIIIVFFIIYWIYTFVILNSHGTIPYKFF